MSRVLAAARVLALAVCASLSAVPCSAQTHPPAEAFGQLPVISQPELSPDGKHLAAIKAYNGRSAAFIYELGVPGAKPIVIPYTDGSIAAVTWKNDNRLLITIKMDEKAGDDTRVNAWFRTVAIGTAGQNPAVMFRSSKSKDINYSASEIADIDMDDSDHIYMPLWSDYGDGDVRNLLFQVDVNDGHNEVSVRGSSKTEDWIMDGHGHVVARIDQYKHPLIEHLLLYQNEDWKDVASFDASGGRGAGIAGLTADGSALVQFINNDKIGTAGLVRLALPDVKPQDLFFDKKYDVDDALHDPWTGRIIGVSYIDDQEEYKYFDPKMQALQKGLEAAFPGMSVHAVSWDTAADRAIVEVTGPHRPTAFYLLDRNTHHATQITQAYRELNDTDLGEVKSYPYKARDGLDIPAYLTLPPGKPAKNLPTIIMPHGGPMARDQMAFDWEAQFLANRGYAVLQPNFRGSSGYGRKFEEAGYGQWGLKMQDDVTDGVQKLIADGIADPKRICIVGGSYGGYAALAGAAFTPDLYACAASWAGVSDLKEFLSTRSEDYGRDSAMISSWSRFIGDRWDDSDKLKAASPAENAARIKCPVLLMHGVADSTVRINQSEIMQRALERAGKHVEFIKFDKETHYMETADTRIRVLKELERFLAANIGN